MLNLLKKLLIFVILWPVLAFTAEGPSIVLLPIEGKNLDLLDRTFYNHAIKEILSEKYKVYSGEAINKELKKIGSKNKRCKDPVCLKRLAKAFNADLTCSGRIDRYKANYLIYFEIRNVPKNQVETSWARTCDNCSKYSVRKKLAELLNGKDLFADGSSIDKETQVKTSAQKSVHDRAILVIDSIPRSADVYINGVFKGKTPYQNTSLKAEEEISVTLKKLAYQNKRLKLRLKKGKNVYDNIRLDSVVIAFGELYITSKPSGANVYIGNKLVGKTPYRNRKIKTGTYSLALKKDLYLPFGDYKIRIYGNKTTERNIDLKPTFGSLNIETEPFNVKIKIFDKNKKLVFSGTTPGQIKLEHGQYSVQLQEKNYEPKRLTVDIKAGKELVIGKDRTKLKRLEGELIVSTKPYSNIAKIYINGILMGNAPDNFILPEGAYEVEVKAGYKSGSQKIYLKNRAKKSLKIALKRSVLLTKSWWLHAIDVRLIYIRPYPFIMGSTRDPQETPHRVTISKGFYIGATEVTQKQWRDIMGYNPSRFGKCGDDCPVESVSWYEVQKFFKKLNIIEGTDKYRLPTEAEWEYAARSGTTTPFAFGLCLPTDHANYNGNYPMPGCLKGIFREKTVEVGTFPPNNFGLYDMYGNVWEWCSDWFGEYPNKEVIDPQGPDIYTSYKVVRGGSWRLNGWYCRSSNRGGYAPENKLDHVGFRIVRSEE